MKIRTLLFVSVVPALFSSAAMAQSFTYDVVWKPVESIGGMTGPDGKRTGAGGVVDGAYTTTYQDGSVQKGTVRCVGGIQGTAGEAKGRNGLMTMEWYSNTASRGTGQWYGGQ